MHEIEEDTRGRLVVRPRSGPLRRGGLRGVTRGCPFPRTTPPGLRVGPAQDHYPGA